MSNLPARISPQDAITRVRGHAVILDTDLASLYGVPVNRLNEQAVVCGLFSTLPCRRTFAATLPLASFAAFCSTLFSW